MKKLKKIISVLLMLTIVLTLVPSQNVQAAVKLNKKSISLEYHNYTNLKVTGTSKKVTWKSSNKNVVTVNSKGKLFASGVGSAYVSAKVGNKTYKCKVKTFKKDLTAFDLDLIETMYVGETNEVIMITSTPYYYMERDLNYTSSNPSVATVNSEGVVYGVSAGTAVITATYGNLSQSMNITVKEKQFSASSSSINLTSNGTDTVTITNDWGTRMTYSIANTSVVSAKWGDWDGNTCPITITAKKSGTTTMTISDTTGHSITVSITVESPNKFVYENSYSLTYNPGFSGYGTSIATINNISITNENTRLKLTYQITKEPQVTTVLKDYEYFRYRLHICNSSGVIVENLGLSEAMNIGDTVQKTISFTLSTPDTYTISFVHY